MAMAPSDAAARPALEELERTREAAAQDLLVQRTYQAPGGKGCVMFFLTGALGSPSADRASKYGNPVWQLAHFRGASVRSND